MLHFIHKWGDWHTEEHPCIQVRRCSKLDCPEKQERTVHQYGDWIYQSEGDCQQVKICARCGDRIERTELVHQFGDLEYIQSDSCIQFKECKRCGKRELLEEKHLYGQWEYHSENVCEKRTVCSHCGRVQTKFEHESTECVSTESDCRSDIKCGRCGMLLRTEYHHKWSEKVVPLRSSLKNAIEYEERMAEELEKLVARYESNPQNLRYANAFRSRLDSLQRAQGYRDLLVGASEDTVSRFCTACKMPISLGSRETRAKRLKGFLSYRHTEKDYANAVDRALRSHGYVITRDIRDMDISENLYEFMDRVKESRYVVALLSDEYLRSKYCMYEATKIISALLDRGCRLFVICIGVDPADGATCDKYLQYWTEVRDQARENGGNEGDIAAYTTIVDGLQMFLSAVNSVKYAVIQKLDQLDGVLLKQILSMLEKIE